MRGGSSLASEPRSLNGAGSLYSPLPSSGISDQLKQSAEAVSPCDLPKPKLWAQNVDQWAVRR